MSRELRRLLLSPERLAQAPADAEGSLRVSLLPDECHYLQRVLRLRDGDPFAVVDGAGHLWAACLQAGQALLAQPQGPAHIKAPPPAVALQLAVALPRRDGEVILRMATELGLDRIQPLLAERSVVDRWNAQRAATIVREAVEQCERLWAPELLAPAPVTAVLHHCHGIRLWATTRRSDLPSLAEVLSGLRQHALKLEDSPPDLGGPITVAIGPEGGWSDAEDQLAREQGWQRVQLGPTILRSGTAAVAAAALLSSWRASLAG